MRKYSWSWLLGFYLLASVVQAQTTDSVFQRCGVADYERLLQQRDPNRLQQLNTLNKQIDQYLSSSQGARTQADTTIYRIPIVVHVIHNTASGTIGGTGNSNISDAQILTQIQVLNEDYRRQAGTNGYNTSSIGADARIQFFLATTDPDGNSTSGITRHYYSQKSSFNVFTDDVLLSQIVSWPSDRYLNIWVTTLQSNYLGYTQFPVAADTLKGLPTSVNNDIDGTIIDYRVFGRQTGTVNLSLYLLGRTVTHEIGHWLGLIHPWGDGTGCNEDYVADTPLTADRSNAPSNCNQTYSTCVAGKQTRDLVEDYMMYSPDACMNLFTAGQVARMRAVLALSPRRVSLLKSVSGALAESDKLTVSVYPNPATTDPSVDVLLKGTQSFELKLFDATGRQLRMLSYASVPSTHLTLPVAGLASGVYIVRVKTETETVSKRLLVP